jgi:hypothetical protein
MSAILVSVSPSGTGSEIAGQDTFLNRLSCLFDSFMANMLLCEWRCAMIRVNVQGDDRRYEKNRAIAPAFVSVGLPFRS